MAPNCGRVKFWSNWIWLWQKAKKPNVADKVARVAVNFCHFISSRRRWSKPTSSLGPQQSKNKFRIHRSWTVGGAASAAKKCIGPKQQNSFRFQQRICFLISQDGEEMEPSLLKRQRCQLDAISNQLLIFYNRWLKISKLNNFSVPTPSFLKLFNQPNRISLAK